MAKTKKISVNTLEKIEKDIYIPVSTVTWNDIEIEIKKHISFQDIIEIVEGVCDTCFASNDEGYLPEVRDCITKVYIIEKYTNIRLPQNVDRKYEIIYHTGVFDVILEYIDKTQYQELLDSISKKIEYISNSNVEELHRELDSLYNSFETLENNLSELFNGIDRQTMIGIANAMKDGKIDEEKLMKSYFDNKNKKESVSSEESE